MFAVHLCSKGSFPIAPKQLDDLLNSFSIYKNAKCLKWELNDNMIRILSWDQMRQMVAVGGFFLGTASSSKFVSYLFPFCQTMHIFNTIQDTKCILNKEVAG